MSDWKHQQMIKASAWPLAAELLAPTADFTARLEGGLVPLHWACREGKAGVVKYMIEYGANVHDLTDDGKSMLELVIPSKSFQTVMLLIDRLKATGAPAPDEALRKRLNNAFSKGHPDARNRLQQTLRDWDRIAKTVPSSKSP
ncbi:ankyrin repeat protein [Hydrogenophaga palleronii]|uniref:Ankyrin repeat protein n=1 Tax=Hydrogenophaga palleronii TaxID=65655 RepID=A0ABU1WNG7_9BURK|nr:ankyrin repeat domain-containing protein [Hydrogenophaga palleronii]MDR7150467.1 ankyrin repeat protein [Hydrogenophaga palleronii]